MKHFIRIMTLVLAAVFVFSSTALSASAAKPGKSGIESIELKGEKNVTGDPSPVEVGWAGAAIKVGDKDITVTGVGRMFFTGANISHAFLITDSEGALMLSGVTVQGYEDSTDGTFEYAYLEKSEYVTLKAGETYYLCSDFYGPTDKFYEASEVKTTGAFNFVGKVSLNADGSWAYTEAAGIDYFPVDILYMIDGEETTPSDGNSSEQEKPDNTDPSGNTSIPEKTDRSFPIVPVAVGAGVLVIAAAIIVIVAVRKKRSNKH